MREEKRGGYRGGGRAEDIGPPRPVPSASAWSDASVAQDDLAAILRELGLGDHARPQSPHQVVHAEVLPAIRRLRPEPTGEHLRVGSQVGRTIYRCTPDDPKGHLVGVMDTGEWAAEVVAAVNQARYGRDEEVPDAGT